MEVFGLISDVEVARDATIFVMDPMAYQVRWFDADGRFRGRVGREGRGPGEFRQPTALAIAGDRLEMLDQGRARISVYRRSGADMTHERDIRVPVLASDLCVLGGRRSVVVVRGGSVVHELSDSGTVVRSFGTPVEPPAELLRRARGVEHLSRDRMNAHKLACDSATQTVLVLNETVNTVTAFFPLGQLRWHTALADVFPSEVRIVERPDPRVTSLPNATTARHGSTTAIALAGDGTAVLTVTRRGRTPERGFDSQFESRRIRLSDGREVARAPGRAQVVAVQGGRTFGSVQLAFARVLIC